MPPCRVFASARFGTEGMTTKRINGLFSFLTADTRDTHPLALDLLGYAAHKLQDTEVETFAAQVPSDADHLLRFYKQYFQRQGELSHSGTHAVAFPSEPRTQRSEVSGLLANRLLRCVRGPFSVFD